MTVEQWAGDPRRDIPGQWFRLCPRPSESTDLHNRERVRQFVVDFRDRRLDDIEPVEAASWAIDNGHRVRTVKAMFNDAVKLRLIDESPFAHVDAPRARERDIVVVTDAELLELERLAARKWGEWGALVFAPMIRFAAWTGIRPGELFRLRHTSVDVGEGLVRVRGQWNSKLAKPTDTKNHHDRDVVLLPEAERAFKALPQDDPLGALFPALRGEQMTGRTHGYYWRPVRDLFEDKLAEDHHLRRRLAEDPDDHMDFYELRHRFGTELAHRGCSQYEIGEQMGHRDNGATALKHYIHIDRQRSFESVRARFRDAA